MYFPNIKDAYKTWGNHNYVDCDGAVMVLTTTKTIYTFSREKQI